MPKLEETLKRTDVRIMELLRGFAADKWNFIILLLIVMNIAFRLPVTPHELGSDSFATHGQVNTLLQTHDISWHLNLENIKLDDISSIKDSYPFDEVVTLPASVLMLSQYTGLDIEDGILVLSILTGLLGFFASYIMAREFVDHRLTIFLTSFLFSLSPVFLSLTNWTASPRGFFIALLPLVFWLIFKYENHGHWKYILYAFGLVLMMFPLHRMAMMLLPLMAAFMAARTYAAVYRFLEARNKFIANYLSTITPPILLFAMLVLFSYSIVSNNPMFVQMRWNYQSGILTEGLAPHKIAMNMMVDYWSSEGILFPFFAVGVLVVFTTLSKLQKKVNERYLFLAFCMIAYAPLFVQGEYMTIYMLPLFSLFTALGLKGVASIIQMLVVALRLDRRITSSVFIAWLMMSILFSNFMQEHWVSRIDISSIVDPNTAHKQWMQEQTYQVSLFLMDLTNNVVFSDSLSARRISAIIGQNRMPYFSEEYMTGHTRTTERVKEQIASKQIQYVVENENIPEQYSGAERLYESVFLKSLRNQTDKIYDDGLNGIWNLGDPNAASA
ncbi:MAG: hypothetical protein V1703_04780 [Candidatus Altiarchaeota archaeon]